MGQTMRDLGSTIKEAQDDLINNGDFVSNQNTSQQQFEDGHHLNSHMLSQEQNSQQMLGGFGDDFEDGSQQIIED